MFLGNNFTDQEVITLKPIKNIASNIDILPTLLSASNIRVNNTKFDGVNLLEKNNINTDVIIESIYPNKKYEAKIINNTSEYIFNIDNIIDNNDRLIAIVELIKTLSNASKEEIYKGTMESSEFNFNYIKGGRFYKDCAMLNQHTVEQIMEHIDLVTG